LPFMLKSFILYWATAGQLTTGVLCVNVTSHLISQRQPTEGTSTMLQYFDKIYY